MKKLSDYQGEAAIELWADLLEPITAILGDEEISKVVQSGKPRMLVASTILKNHKKEAEEILLRIDPEPLDGLNIVVRLVNILVEIGERPDIKAFFGFAAQAKNSDESSGSPTESTGGGEN